jgi:hypothetical protein
MAESRPIKRVYRHGTHYDQKVKVSRDEYVAAAEAVRSKYSPDGPILTGYGQPPADGKPGSYGRVTPVGRLECSQGCQLVAEIDQQAIYCEEHGELMYVRGFVYEDEPDEPGPLPAPPDPQRQIADLTRALRSADDLLRTIIDVDAIKPTSGGALSLRQSMHEARHRNSALLGLVPPHIHPDKLAG